MSKCKLVIEARRECYSMDGVRTMTVGQLINILMDYDEDAEIILSHDSGYTYGGIAESDLSEVWDIEEDELENCEGENE